MPSAVKSIQSKASVPRVLVVDDEATLREVIEDVVHRSAECEVITAGTIAEARKILISQPVQVLVADINLPDGKGTSLLPVLQEHQPTASAIVITGQPSMDSAISAMRGGALDFVPKPFNNEQLIDRLRRALDRAAKADKQEKRFDR